MYGKAVSSKLLNDIIHTAYRFYPVYQPMIKNNELTYQNRYSYNNVEERYMLEKFFYSEEKNRFYVLEGGDSYKVSVYSINNVE